MIPILIFFFLSFKKKAKGSGSNSKLTTEVPENFAANEEQILNLELYDEFNNRVVDGSDSVVATLSPSNPSDEIVITNNQDGSYIISITIQVAKSYQLSITVNDQPISGGSFPMTVVPGLFSLLSFSCFMNSSKTKILIFI